MKKRLLAFLLVLIFMLFGCSPKNIKEESALNIDASIMEYSTPQEANAIETSPIKSLDELMELVEQNHRLVIKPVVNTSDYIHDFSENTVPLESFWTEQEYEAEKSLTLQQLEDDLDDLFNILQCWYGLYYYSGGDEVFLAAKQKIIEQCEQADGAITAGNLEKALLEQMQFLKDGHFRINNQAVRQFTLAHIYSEKAFQPYGDTFQVVEDGKVVSGVEGYDAWQPLFKLSISEEGELVYYPVILTTERKAGNITIQYDDGTDDSLSPAPWNSYYDESERKVELNRKGDIPIVFVRNMGFDQAPNDFGMGKEFLETAEQVKDDPVILVDLRSNQGGNMILPMKWLKMVTGQDVPTNFVTLNYMTEENLRSYGENKENPTYIPYEEMIEIGGWEKISDHYMQSNAQPDRVVDNDQLIILLTGKNTGSAAETMVDLAHNLKRTLIVGSNTYGTMASNAYTGIRLPHSGILIQLGTMLSIFPDGYFEEFVGISPDIWVAGDAEELVLKMLERYKN